MSPRLLRPFVRFSSAVVIMGLLASCASPMATPEPTVVPSPTVEPTATAVPPTATPVPPTDTPVPTATFTATPIPPTATPLPPTPTATLKPTKAVTVTPRATVAPMPTVTPGKADVPAGVQSWPSALQTSIQQSLDVVYGLSELLDKMKDGGGVELCAPLLKLYQSVHNAPTYEIGGQSTQFRQAHDLYRQAVNLLDGHAASFQSCGQGGGTIGGLDWSTTRADAERSSQLLRQALDWSNRVALLPSSAPLPAAVARVRIAIMAILSAMDSYLEGNKEPCEPLVAEIDILKSAPTYDVSTQSANVQTAYLIYRQVVDLAIEKTVGITDVCAKGGGRVSFVDIYSARDKFRELDANLVQAIDLLSR